MITYKFYATKKVIPWMLGGENIHPQPDIGDNFFDFTQLQGKQFNFEDIFTATIVVDSDQYTYWKVERYINNVLDRSYYFYTSRVLSILKSAFTLELSLDIYLTYTRDFFNNGYLNNCKVYRGTITSHMLLNYTYEDTIPFRKALKNVEGNVANGDDGYSQIIPIKLSAPGGTNLYPIQVEETTVGGQKQNPFHSLIGIINDRTNDTQRDKVKWHTFQDKQTKRVFSVKKEGLVSETITSQMDKLLYKGYQIIALGSDKPYQTPWDEAEKNVANSYFAVFRNKEGSVDAYPLIGRLKARYRVPVYSRIGTPPNEANNNVFSENEYILGRIYTGYDTFYDGELYNDWESIRKEYIENYKEWYPANSFLGIYRGIFPNGKTSGLTLILGDTLYGNTIYSRTEAVNYDFLPVRGGSYIRNIPWRICYRIAYEDTFKLNLSDYENYTHKPFELCSSGKPLADTYIKLLQPITIGTCEIIPARYCFLANKVGSSLTYTIPFTGTFIDGFKLFCNVSLYNSESLSCDFGRTLPTISDKYFRQLEAIEQQKNAGVAAAVGNIFGRPLNWLSGGGSLGTQMGLNDTLRNSFGESNSSTQSYNAFWTSGSRDLVAGGTDPRTHTQSSARNWGRDTAQTLYNTSNRRGAINVGGLGGFIGDFVSIGNAIKNSAIAKRNAGVGYITTTDTDIYSAIIHSSFVNDISPFSSLSTGIVSVGGKKVFDKYTIEKYKYYYNNWGFLIGDIVPREYINDLIREVNNGNIAYVEVDRNWCLTNCVALRFYNDNVVRNAIIDQLSGGIRMRRFT